MTGIEWTDATWNPVVGCSPVSPGCLNCYAARMAVRLEQIGRPEYAPRLIDTRGREHRGAVPDPVKARCRTVRIAQVKAGRPVFTGDVRTVPERLTEPLHWKKPRMVFVNSMSDIFHESVPFEFVDRVFAVMALCPRHTFQVLTKRPERMAEYAASRGIGGTWYDNVIHEIERLGTYDKSAFDAATEVECNGYLRNVWLGASVEDQARADERIPNLVKCPAAVRFLSCEPLLGPIDLTPWLAHLQWVIVGGESGPKARPCDVGWLYDFVRQCKAAHVPLFVKQLGSLPSNGPFRQHPVTDRSNSPHGGNGRRFVSRKGADPSEWPDDLRVRQMPKPK